VNVGGVMPGYNTDNNDIINYAGRILETKRQEKVKNEEIIIERIGIKRHTVESRVRNYGCLDICLKDNRLLKHSVYSE